MTISKLTNNIKPLDEVDKINEIIDELDNANVAIDSKSITKNASDELQTVGVIDSNNTTNAIKTWTGTKVQYEAIATKDANTLYFCTDSGEIYLGSVLISNKTNGKDVGDVVFSLTPKTDAGLHLIDGALIQGDGIYSAFVTRIAGLASTYPNIFVSESDWQTAVSTYGVCGKFVYDNVNNTVRLPKATGKLDGTTDVSVLGDLAPLIVKLPNITGNLIGGRSGQGTVDGAFSRTGAVSAGVVSEGQSTSQQMDFSASRSSSVYSGNGSDTTIHEQAINVLLYIVIATSTKTDTEADIDEVVTDLNGKADVDLTNVANTAGFRKLVEVYNNGASWCKVLREYNPQNGSYVGLWCEQGGQATVPSNNNTSTINLLKPYKDTNYIVSFTRYNPIAGTVSAAYVGDVCLQSITTSSFSLNRGYNSPVRWQACGYIN